MKKHQGVKLFPVVLPLIVHLAVCSQAPARGFEGRISAAAGRPGALAGWLYTVGTNSLRVEMTETNHPNAIDVVDLSSGQITLIQPMNRTFVRFMPGVQNAPPPRAYHPNSEAQPLPPRPPAGIGPTNFPGMPGMPAPPGGLPPGVGPQANSSNAPGVPPASPGMPVLPGGLPPGIGLQAQAGAAPTRPAMPAMPMLPPGGGFELKATGETTNLFKYACHRYEIKQNDQTMEIWATDQLCPFQVYLPREPRQFGPPIIEEQWAGLVTAKKLFPLSAVLRTENGVERYRFGVRSITPRRLTAAEIRGFEPPDGYVELPPPPF